MASGDIALTTPKSMGTLQVMGVVIALSGTNSIEVNWSEAGSNTYHRAIVRNGTSDGFTYAAGVFTDGVTVSTPTGFTDVVTALTTGGPSGAVRRVVQAIAAAGVISAAGTVA